MRDVVFSMRLNAEEQRMLLAVAAYLQRTRSDVVRLLIRSSAQELGVVADEPIVQEVNSDAEHHHCVQQV